MPTRRDPRHGRAAAEQRERRAELERRASRSRAARTRRVIEQRRARAARCHRRAAPCAGCRRRSGCAAARRRATRARRAAASRCRRARTSRRVSSAQQPHGALRTIDRSAADRERDQVQREEVLGVEHHGPTRCDTRTPHEAERGERRDDLIRTPRDHARRARAGRDRDREDEPGRQRRMQDPHDAVGSKCAGAICRDAVNLGQARAR